ncbi:MAG: serine hydrolase [Altererythrobacter sp.]
MTLRAIAAVALLLAPIPAAAQSQQDELDARYDRALAAGYKALMLCSAIANAEANGTTRTAESVEAWELTGIQAPLDNIVGELPYVIERYREHATGAPAGAVAYVSVEWADNMPARTAYYQDGRGCSLSPIGQSVDPGELSRMADVENAEESFEFTLTAVGAGEFTAPASPLDEPMGRAMGDEYGAGTRTTAVLIRRAGEEDGWKETASYKEGFDENTPQRTWSVAKSIAATLVGAAVQRGDLAFNPEHYGFPDAPPVPVANPVDRADYSLDLMLRMASGRYSDTPGNRTDALYFGGSTVRETALHWPLINEPGTVFRYANNDTLAAVMTISDILEEHPPAEFFRQVGMTHTVAETDWVGDYILSSQVWSTAEDLANLGELYLNDGVWHGTRILPEGWREYVSTPAGPQPDGPFGYGAGFWLLNKSEGVPPDAFAAFGNRGQYVVIVPSRDIVIVRRGEDPAGSRFDIAGFTRDVLAALEE